MTPTLLLIDSYTQSVRPLPAGKLLNFNYTACQMVGAALLDSLPTKFPGHSLFLDGEGNLLSAQHHFYFEGTSNLVPGRALLMRSGPGNFSSHQPLTAQGAYARTSFLGELDPVSALLDYSFIYEEAHGHLRSHEERIQFIRNVDQLIREPREPESAAHQLLELQADSLLAWSQFLSANDTDFERVLSLAKGGRKRRELVLTGSHGNGTDVFPHSDIDVALVLNERNTTDQAQHILAEVERDLAAAGYETQLDPPVLSIQLKKNPFITIDLLLSRGRLYHGTEEIEFMDPIRREWVETTCLADKKAMMALDRQFAGQVLRLVRLVKLVNHRFQLGLSSLYIETFVLNTVASRIISGITRTDRMDVERRVRQFLSGDLLKLALGCDAPWEMPVERLSLPEAMVSIFSRMQRSNLRPAYFGLVESGMLNADLYLDRLEDENLDHIAKPRPACRPRDTDQCLKRIATAESALATCFSSDDDVGLLDRLEKLLGTGDAVCAPWMLPHAVFRLENHRRQPTWGGLRSHADLRYKKAVLSEEIPKHWEMYIELLRTGAIPDEGRMLEATLNHWLSIGLGLR